MTNFLARFGEFRSSATLVYGAELEGLVWRWSKGKQGCHNNILFFLNNIYFIVIYMLTLKIQNYWAILEAMP